MKYLENHKMPQFQGKDGMSVKAFEQAGQKYVKECKDYVDKLETDTNKVVDCVGTKASFCKAEGE